MGFGNSNANASPKLHSLSLTQSGVGLCVKMGWGTFRIQADLLWAGDFKSVKQKQQGGKGMGGKSSVSYDYLTAMQGALCAGPISGVNAIWANNGRLTQTSASENYTVPSGGGSYTVANAAKFSIDHGAARADAYSVTADDYGSPGAITYSGTQHTPMKLVTGTPSAGEYTLSGGTYTFAAADAGKSITLSYSYSLYVLEEQEDYLVPLTSPYEITVKYANYFKRDMGVIFVDTGEDASAYYSQSGGNYYFDASVAGRAVAISYTWDNSQFESDPTSTLALTVINGTQGQNPWSYMETNHASMALGYSGIATVNTPSLDCGPSATIPQYNYEVAGPLIVGGGIQDANLADVIYDYLTNALWGVGFNSAWIGSAQLTQTKKYWQAASFFGSPALISQESASDTIQKWLDAGNAAAFVSEGLLKVLPYGDTTLVGNGATYTPQTSPVVDLNDDDYLGDDASDPIQIVRQPRQDAYNHVRVQFNNRLNSYNAEIVDEFDQSAIAKYGQRDESVQNYDFICTMAAATFSANIRLKRLQGIRETYKFTVSGIRYWYLEPMDLVTLTDSWLGLNKTPVRITEIEEDEKGNYEITAEAFPWGTSTATLYPKGSNSGSFPTQAQAGPGNVNAPIFFEALDRLTGYSGYELWIGLSGNNPNWGGCRVWMSENGEDYVPLTGTNGDNRQMGQCRMGVLTAELPVGTSPDATHTLAVTLAQSLGELQSVTSTQAQQLRTLCYLSTNELVGFETARLTGQYEYNLTNLIRGALGTTIADSPAGTKFLRLDSSPFTWKFDASQIGKTLYFKFTSFNLIQQCEQSLADVEAYEYAITGNFQGAISRNGGTYIGGSGSSSITFNTDFSYTTTTTSVTISGTITLYLTNNSSSQISIPINVTITGLTAGTEYWFFPYAKQDAYGNWVVSWVTNGNNGVTGAVGTPAYAFAGTTSPLGVNKALSQFYATGLFTPLSAGGLNVTLPTSGTGGGTGGGTPPPVCLHDSMLVDEKNHGNISALQLWKFHESGESLTIRDGKKWVPVDSVYRAACKDWCRILFENGEEAITTEGHWWLTDSGQLVTSSDLEGCNVECDGGFTKANSVEFFTSPGYFVRIVVRSTRRMHNTGMRDTKLHTHNFITQNQP